MNEYVVAVVVAVITSGGMLLGQRITAKGQRASGMTPSYEALDKHVTRVQKEMSELWEEHRSLKTRFEDMSDDRDRFAEAFEDVKQLVRQFVGWINSGAKPPPPPIPPHLRDQIGDYEVARVTEISRTTTERITYPEETPNG